MIYTITAVSKIVTRVNIKFKEYKTREYRVIGYFFDKEKAIECLTVNHCDINEDTYYEYGVIEQINEGFYGGTMNEDDELWFKFDVETGKYLPTEKPKDLIRTVAFSMG